MLTFKETMDPHALVVERDGKMIASLQWHPERPLRIVSLGLYEVVFTLAEMREMIAELERRVDRDL